MKDRFSLLTLVVHDQGNDIRPDIALYEQSLQAKGLPDIPFHASPLLNGHGRYEGMGLAALKRLLSSFRVFFRHAQVRYHCIKLKTAEYAAVEALAADVMQMANTVLGR